MDYSKSLDQIAVGHLNGTIKIYNPSHSQLFHEVTFANHGVLHKIEWNPKESHLVGYYSSIGTTEKKTTIFFSSYYLHIKTG